MNIDNNLKGFTLIELVIALSIFAILASAAVSAYVGIANKAFKVQEDLTMNSLQKGALLYYAKYNSWWGYGCEDPFMLLENPPPHRLDYFGRILNVEWVLVCNNGMPSAVQWLILCPHRGLVGEQYNFFPVGAKYYIVTAIPH